MLIQILTEGYREHVDIFTAKNIAKKKISFGV